MSVIQPSLILPNRVRTHPPQEVTVRSVDEVAPATVGLRDAQVERIWKSVTYHYMSGVHPAISLCIRRRGKVILDRTIGHARGNAPGDSEEAVKVLATPETAFNLFSCTKMVTAMLIHSLVEKRKLHYEDRVVDYLPSFGSHGKDVITIRHLLTHRAGIPFAPPADAPLDIISDSAAVVELLSEMAPDYTPGKTVAYHALTSGFVLAEIVRKITGEDIRTLLDKVVRKRLGFRFFNYGVSKEDMDIVALNSFTGMAPRGPVYTVLKRALGLDLEGIKAILNDPRFMTGVVPSGNIFATANEMSRFMEVLLRGGSYGKGRIFKENTVRTALSRQTFFDIDRSLMVPMSYSMGLMLGGENVSFFGHESPRAFGHIGFSNVMAWADPDRDISVAFLNNGKPLFTPEAILWFNIVRVISQAIPPERRTTNHD